MTVAEMPTADLAKQSKLDAILEHAADILGDITPTTLELYYSRYPDARQLFIEHGCGYTARLEQSMVDSALYCLMVWYERPLEIEVIIAEAVPHHQLLEIPVSFFSGLEATLIDIIDQTVDEADVESKNLLAELKRDLLILIES